jgi:hypothetical protein
VRREFERPNMLTRLSRNASRFAMGALDSRQPGGRVPSIVRPNVVPAPGAPSQAQRVAPDQGAYSGRSASDDCDVTLLFHDDNQLDQDQRSNGIHVMLPS